MEPLCKRQGALVAWYDPQGFSRPDLLDEAVDAILRFIASKERLVDDFQDGMQFRVGWSSLTLRAGENGFVLCEPDFSTGALVDHVTVSAQIAAMQQRLNTRTNTAYSPCHCFETVGLFEGALEVPDLLLVRSDRMSPVHSGWMITPRNRRDAALQELPSCLLLGTRPHLLQALSLPDGSLVTVSGEEILAVRDVENNDLLGDGDDEPTWLPQEEAPRTAGWLDRLFGS
ncbi:MAG: hypothetical protein FJX76_17370 [Armatimonadetes bacterium]|nr:hypothetical protein [Armatimonadota bacterium]